MPCPESRSSRRTGPLFAGATCKTFPKGKGVRLGLAGLPSRGHAKCDASSIVCLGLSATPAPRAQELVASVQLLLTDVYEQTYAQRALMHGEAPAPNACAEKHRQESLGRQSELTAFDLAPGPGRRALSTGCFRMHRHEACVRSTSLDQIPESKTCNSLRLARARRKQLAVPPVSSSRPVVFAARFWEDALSPCSPWEATPVGIPEPRPLASHVGGILGPCRNSSPPLRG